jgi:hypothetical protein
MSTNTEQKVYSQDELNQPFQLKDFGAHNPYLRRAESVSGTTNSYQSLLTINIIHEYLGPPARKTSMCLLLPVVYHDDFREVERAALQHLESRIRENDPVALQVAVVLSQLVGKDSSCLPRVSEDLKDAAASLEAAKVTPYEQGRIVFTRYPANLSIQFTIVGDVISVAGADGEEIVAFETHRTVNVGYPAQDGSVTCTTTTLCQNVHAPSVK